MGFTLAQTLTLPPELQGPGPRPQPAEPAAQAPRPLPKAAPKATLKRRHHWIGASFAVAVVLPGLIAALYLYVFALPQYASTVAFSVREEGSSSPMDLIGGLSDLTGSSSKDADILFDYLHSQQIVRTLSDDMSLDAIWAVSGDPVFSLRRDPTIEDLHTHWQRKVRVFYDATAGLLTVRAHTFRPEDAERLTTAILEQSRITINALEDAARQDATRLAQLELDRATTGLTAVRKQMMQFRADHEILDPETDVAGRLGLLNSLQLQKAQALIDYDLLLTEQTRTNDPRLDLARRRIEVVDDLIAKERAEFGTGDDAYANVIAEYEVLAVDLEFAQTAYVAARASFASAQADASRVRKYVAAHVPPTRAERAEYPKRFLWLGSIVATLSLVWAIGLLIYYSVRDRR